MRASALEDEESANDQQAAKAATPTRHRPPKDSRLSLRETLLIRGDTPVTTTIPENSFHWFHSRLFPKEVGLTVPVSGLGLLFFAAFSWFLFFLQSLPICGSEANLR